MYLGQKVQEYTDRSGRQLVVAWGSECQVTHKDVGHLQSNQEEADTKMILHDLDATANGATQLQIRSPDTDVFVLAIPGSFLDTQICVEVSVEFYSSTIAIVLVQRSQP